MRYLDMARDLDRVKSWEGARIEQKWVERLQLDAEQLGLVVVDDLPDAADLEVHDDPSDEADLEVDNDLPR